ncbi:MAG: penicillin-insensitive murein endopeptidase [Rhodospirillaceae bacterium]|nr:penicillin-insensitive murein endopeptidase [Rhodospirillaceae bacterium]
MAIAAAVAIAGLSPAPAAAQAPNSDAFWATFTQPVAGAPQVIGGYSNGCLFGAQPIPLEGPGHVVIRTQRNRYWGHPRLVAFVEWLGQQAAQEQLGLLMVADAAQPRGGPISGHASHELGLDIDIWLQLLPSRAALSEAARAEPQEVSFVDEAAGQVRQDLWTPAHTRLYQLAASYPGVARIFAHPAIKAQLCRTAGPDRAWLARVRPWYGHTGHMHVRLDCPDDSPACQNQTPVAADDGCGAEVASWLVEVARPPSPVVAAAGPPPPLPAGCAGVMGR